MPKIKSLRGIYPKQQLMDAVCAVKKGEMTSVKASQFYKVPQSTIRSHVTNSSLRIGAGRHCYLSTTEEKDFVNLIKSLESIGVRVTKPILGKIAGEYIKMISNDTRFISKYSCFGQRKAIRLKRVEMKLLMCAHNFKIISWSRLVSHVL